MAERNPQEEWLVSARRELGDLQRSYSELQSRIDDLRYRIYFTCLLYTSDAADE